MGEVPVRVVYVVPGTGDAFYCQNCVRDRATVIALRAAGHDVVVIPVYLPPSLGEDMGAAPVFYGAVRIYLEQKFPWTAKLPRWCGRLLDSSRCLAWASRKAGSTKARGNEDMTLSMLRGEAGFQAAELQRLISWLTADGVKTDVIHLSNALLLGMAAELKRQLRAAVVCSLQDEDSWVDTMRPDKAREVWSLMAQKAREADALVAVSRYYAERMSARLETTIDRLRVVPVGIDMEGHTVAASPPNPPTIGFLSRLARSEGLELLADAFVLLKQNPRLRQARLVAMGGQIGEDDRTVRSIRRRLRRAGILDAFAVAPDFGRPGRLQFLSSISVLSVPVLQGDATGAYLLEAMASGVPVVQPRLGAFPEIVAATGGGRLYSPNAPATLAEALEPLLLDPAQARALGMRGREAILASFTAARAAGQLAGIYASLCKKDGRVSS
jgi:glycosyltransferase involved in cell wall biosynthesis